MEEKTAVNISNEFLTNASGDNAAKIKRAISELREASVSPQNYERWREKSESMVLMLDTQVENIYSEYVEDKKVFNDVLKEERVKEAMTQNEIVPLRVYDVLLRIARRQKELAMWFYMKSVLLSVLQKKLAVALREANAFEIKRDALKEMREMETKRNELFLESMRAFSEKLSASLENIQRENIIAQRENFAVMAELIMDVIDKTSQGVKPTFADVKSRIESKRSVEEPPPLPELVEEPAPMEEEEKQSVEAADESFFSADDDEGGDI